MGRATAGVAGAVLADGLPAVVQWRRSVSLLLALLLTLGFYAAFNRWAAAYRRTLRVLDPL
jgi:hypothetical protein